MTGQTCSSTVNPSLCLTCDCITRCIDTYLAAYENGTARLQSGGWKTVGTTLQNRNIGTLPGVKVGEACLSSPPCQMLGNFETAVCTTFYFGDPLRYPCLLVSAATRLHSKAAAGGTVGTDENIGIFLHGTNYLIFGSRTASETARDLINRCGPRTREDTGLIFHTCNIMLDR